MSTLRKFGLGISIVLLGAIALNLVLLLLSPRAAMDSGFVIAYSLLVVVLLALAIAPRFFARGKAVWSTRQHLSLSLVVTVGAAILFFALAAVTNAVDSSHGGGIMTLLVGCLAGALMAGVLFAGKQMTH